MYIGNLSYNVRESDLRDVMEEFGTVDSVKLIIDRDTRRSKGFAFVEMPEDSEAQNAIRDLNGATYEGRQMVVKVGRYGKFIACPGYPECKNIIKYVEKTGGKCPKCGGDVIIKRTKTKRIFYGCSNYPECDFVSWNEPTNEKCPQCGGILFKKKGKKPTLFCATEGCGYTKTADTDDK